MPIPAFDWHHGPLAQGLACYQSFEFCAAHEHWELVWLTLREPEKSFLQALIQTSAAFHHLGRGNLRGAQSLLRRAHMRFQSCPPSLAGIAVEPLRHDVASWLHALQGTDAPRPAAYPRIKPVEPAARI